MNYKNEMADLMKSADVQWPSKQGSRNGKRQKRGSSGS